MWANGNGGTKDNCGADGYTLSIYTISIGALQVGGNQAGYDERCSAKLASNFVNNNYDEQSVVSAICRAEQLRNILMGIYFPDDNNCRRWM